MNIKKIIKEAIEDFKWAEDTEPSLFETLQYILEPYEIYIVVDNIGSVVIIDKRDYTTFLRLDKKMELKDVINIVKLKYENCLHKYGESDGITQEYLDLYNHLLSYNKIEESNKHLDKFLRKLSLLKEVKDVISPEFEWDVISNDEPSPEYVWDFPQETKKELDLSKKWVKTKEDVIGYLNLLLKKIKSLPSRLKKKIIKYVLASFLGILTLNQITSITNTIEGNDYQSGIRFEMPTFKKETPIVKKTEIRVPSQKLFNHLKKEEGIGGKPVLYFYDLGDGAYTTGYGHAVFPNPGRGSTGGDYEFVPNYEDIVPYTRKNRNKKITRITSQQAEQLLQDDMLKASDGINTILDEWKSKGINPKITQGMYDAMVSIAYNHGITNLRMSKFIQYVKRSQFQEAKEEIKNISSNLFDRYPGLKTRREKESRLFMS